MISDAKMQELNEFKTKLLDLSTKEQKSFQVEMLHKYVDKVEKFEELNKKELNKLILLLEYTVQAALDKDETMFNQRYKSLRRHAQKYFKVYHAGELQSLGIGTGMALGVSIGVAIGAGLQNVAMGIPIGIGVGLALGSGIGSQNEAKAKEEGRIL
jgi:thiamine pyrophosphate-dependent acetolactate synthase large subunit-like protein